MSLVRTPTPDDLEAVLELTRNNRALLAALEPRYWRPSDNADESHAGFVRGQIENDDLPKRVLENDGRVVGYAVSFRHPSGFFFVDDVCLSNEADWQTDGRLLFEAVSERPALMTAPHGDEQRVRAAELAGLVRTGNVRLVLLDEVDPPSSNRRAIDPPADLSDPPILHVWMLAMPPETMTFFGDGDDGYVGISQSLAAPSIYDPGGPSAVIDRVVGSNRHRMVLDAVAFAKERGDAQIILVVARDDRELIAIADGLDARRPVDIFAWP